MQVSEEELKFLLKQSKVSGFIAAFTAIVCVLVIGSLFGLYIYKSYESEIEAVAQNQTIGNVHNNGVMNNANKANTGSNVPQN